MYTQKQKLVHATLFYTRTHLLSLVDHGCKVEPECAAGKEQEVSRIKPMPDRACDLRDEELKESRLLSLWCYTLVHISAGIAGRGA